MKEEGLPIINLAWTKASSDNKYFEKVETYPSLTADFSSFVAQIFMRFSPYDFHSNFPKDIQTFVVVVVVVVKWLVDDIEIWKLDTCIIMETYIILNTNKHF